MMKNLILWISAFIGSVIPFHAVATEEIEDLESSRLSHPSTQSAPFSWENAYPEHPPIHLRRDRKELLGSARKRE